jgi:hypothetical protein
MIRGLVPTGKLFFLTRLLIRKLSSELERLRRDGSGLELVIESKSWTRRAQIPKPMLSHHKGQQSWDYPEQ